MGGGTPLIVKIADISRNGVTTTITTDTTWQQLYDAIANGTPCYLGFAPNFDPCDSLPTAEELGSGHVMVPIFSAYEYNGSYLVQDAYESGLRTAIPSPNEVLTYQTSCNV